MTLQEFFAVGVVPGLALLPPNMDTPNARVQLLNTALQESNLQHRRQVVKKFDAKGKPYLSPTGPAISFYQAELGGGMVQGVRTHAATRGLAAMLYEVRGVAPNNQAIWEAIEHDDVLATGLARLLMWSDPAAVPDLLDEEGAWKFYLRLWRPGAFERGSPDERAALRIKWKTGRAQVRRFLEV